MDKPAFPDRQEPVQKSTRYLVLVAAIFGVVIASALGVYTWYTLNHPCDEEVVKAASARLIRQRDRYDHSYQFATSASRDAIVRPVAELQQILMDTQDVVVPACMQTAKNELLNYMATVIRAFLAYGAQETDATVRDLLDQSQTHYDRFRIELEAVKQCAPFCIP